MTRVVIKPELLEALRSQSGPVELCNDSGQVFGRYFPQCDATQYGPLEPQVSDAELLRRAQSDEKTYTTAEVLAYLEKL